MSIYMCVYVCMYASLILKWGTDFSLTTMMLGPPSLLIEWVMRSQCIYPNARQPYSKTMPPPQNNVC